MESPFVVRAGVPALQNVLLSTAADARAIERGDLRVARCPSCDFVANTAFDPGLVVYGDDYDNLQVHSPFFEGYVDTLVDRLVSDGVRGVRVVEVGCGNGDFLRRLCERGGNTGVGFDGAYRGPEHPAPGVWFVKDFYGPRWSHVPADVVVCRHVIEHVPRPLDLLRDVRAAVEGRDARVVFETPAVEWILEHGVFHDFFYEHCSYFSERSLPAAMEAAGFEATRVERLFGGQYLWVEARVAPAPGPPVVAASLGRSVEHFRIRDADELARAAAHLGAMASKGRVAVWGAGAKGVTFLNLLDPGGSQIDCVVDVNPAKQGRFVAGTGHPIVPPGELVARGVEHVVVMNPNYLDECAATARAVGAVVTFSTQDGGWADVAMRLEVEPVPAVLPGAGMQD
ncbi:MAG TPA: class I SAM-dependent methyltransferase [Acidimicrobiia bacterium]|nr:class I SAM-dependent methyltransferase [Acidimicrobiia bacterium]